MTQIPVYEDHNQRRIMETVPFKPNLNVYGARYKNESCNMGLTRNKEGKLVLMYQHEEFPSSDKGFYITEEEAYELCLNRGKQCLAEKLKLEPHWEE